MRIRTRKEKNEDFMREIVVPVKENLVKLSLLCSSNKIPKKLKEEIK